MCITLHVDTHIRPIAACQKLKRGLEVFAEASLPKSIPVLSDARFPGAALAAAAAVRQRNRDLAELKACVAQVSAFDHQLLDGGVLCDADEMNQSLKLSFYTWGCVLVCT